MNNKELSAYAYQSLHFNFHWTIMWLENFIEEAKLVDGGIRKQTDTSAIQWKDKMTFEKARNNFSTSLFIYSMDLEDSYETNEKPFLIREFQQELYKWIDTAGITAEKSSDFLKSVIFEINEVIKTNWQKLRREKENRKRGIEIDDPKYVEKMNEVFGKVNQIQQTELQKAQNIAGKKWNEIEIETRFKGNTQAGEKIFQEIVNSLVNHQDFYFVEQKDGKGKWKKEETNKTTTVQKSKLESNKTDKQEGKNNENHSLILWLGLTGGGLIILLIGWMAFWKSKRNDHNQKNHGKT